MRAQLTDLVMAYDDHGHGQPLLLIHGHPLNRRMWRLQLEGLPDAARIIAPDLRGHGESEVIEGPYRMERLADDCAELLDELEVTGPVVVGGLSMGGYVALAFFRRHAARVAGLILAATRAGADSPAAQVNREKSIVLAREKGPQAIVEAMLPKMLAPGTYTGNTDLVNEVKHIMASNPVEGIIGDLQGMMMRPDSTPLLAQIDRPVLVVHGLEDQLIPPLEAEAMHQRLPNSRLALVPHAGHLVNMEQALSFNAEVRTFLKTL